MKNSEPGLFGIKYSNRDFRLPEAWGKNQFNSSFPASLVAYMHSKKMKCVYIKTDNENKIVHDTITPDNLFGIDPLSDNTFYAFESIFSPYVPYYIGNAPRIDLVIQDKGSSRCLKGLEIKMTALPDNSTCELSEDKYSCEIVIRPDTISYLACSIVKHYVNKKNDLQSILGELSNINWDDEQEIVNHYSEFVDAINNIIVRLELSQEPMVIEPIWKTQGKSPVLEEDCLDVFVWSNLALIHLFTDFAKKGINRIGRTERTLVWLMKMLWDFSHSGSGQFNASLIIDQLSFNTKNDKAFSVNGNITFPLLNCKELTTPRIKKQEIKEIILGGGQKLLSPERRFDAIIFNSPDLFK